MRLELFLDIGIADVRTTMQCADQCHCHNGVYQDTGSSQKYDASDSTLSINQLHGDLTIISPPIISTTTLDFQTTTLIFTPSAKSFSKFKCFSEITVGEIIVKSPKE